MGSCRISDLQLWELVFLVLLLWSQSEIDATRANESELRALTPACANLGPRPVVVIHLRWRAQISLAYPLGKVIKEVFCNGPASLSLSPQSRDTTKESDLRTGRHGLGCVGVEVLQVRGILASVDPLNTFNKRAGLENL